MTDKPDNPPAFPLLYGERDLGHNEGMTLRDWFAGQALVGIFADNDADASSYADVAKCAYGQADAMLHARTKAPNHDG